MGDWILVHEDPGTKVFALQIGHAVLLKVQSFDKFAVTSIADHELFVPEGATTEQSMRGYSTGLDEPVTSTVIPRSR